MFIALDHGYESSILDGSTETKWSRRGEFCLAVDCPVLAECGLLLPPVFLEVVGLDACDISKGFPRA